ncbi:coiled-coil domain-containing protein 97 [Nematostella vectensis]|uniref:coiled-coil domain-containing protein 97 n=1 Tax=Nematostella vectensis TaxID=45351 RepID=UPI0020775C38|nr:coiled-coil domain-containing protein 97 [Nematostella vectensis]
MADALGAKVECGGNDDDMFLRIVNSGVTVKSQQRDEPDLSSEQKIKILEEIKKTNPASFLMRFGQSLVTKDLEYFESLYKQNTLTNYEIGFRLKEIKKHLDQQKHHVEVQNRRYKAMQRLINDSTFFSEEEMRKRNPLLYEQYIGQYLTEEEKLERDIAEREGEPSLSQLMFSKYDAEKTQWIYNYQREQEREMEEEEEDSEEEMEEDSQDKPGNPFKGTPTEEEKEMLRNEFFYEMQEKFLLGKEEEFDYSTVDMNDEYDDLKLREQDEEERYFDDDDDDGDDSDCLIRSSNDSDSKSTAEVCTESRLGDDCDEKNYHI